MVEKRVGKLTLTRAFSGYCRSKADCQALVLTSDVLEQVSSHIYQRGSLAPDKLVSEGLELVLDIR